MQYEETNEAETTTKGRAPTHRLWIVEDQEGAEPEWTEVAPLWETRKGTGFTGRLEKSQIFPAGTRLVILSVKAKQKENGQ